MISRYADPENIVRSDESDILQTNRKDDRKIGQTVYQSIFPYRPQADPVWKNWTLVWKRLPPSDPHVAGGSLHRRRAAGGDVAAGSETHPTLSFNLL